MSDLEKVIKGLECCSSMIPYCSANTCSYYDVPVNCRATLERDALELLKAHETTAEKDWEGLYFCQKCGGSLGFIKKSFKYCPFCGRAVKWDD